MYGFRFLCEASGLMYKLFLGSSPFVYARAQNSEGVKQKFRLELFLTDVWYGTSSIWGT